MICIIFFLHFRVYFFYNFFNLSVYFYYFLVGNQLEIRTVKAIFGWTLVGNV
ncbi:hypothetical protein HanRHA438_Chr09g0406321 [Helianthus annuus]|nr:hypothetical protein HanRHA438_Chr09g0406321 [Helianthus annuus]